MKTYNEYITENSGKPSSATVVLLTYLAGKFADWVDMGVNKIEKGFDALDDKIDYTGMKVAKYTNRVQHYFNSISQPEYTNTEIKKKFEDDINNLYKILPDNKKRYLRKLELRYNKFLNNPNADKAEVNDFLKSLKNYVQNNKE